MFTEYSMLSCVSMGDSDRVEFRGLPSRAGVDDPDRDGVHFWMKESSFPDLWHVVLG